MGLFDIFRRHKKHEDKQEESQAPKSEEKVDSAASAVSEEPSATPENASETVSPASQTAASSQTEEEQTVSEADESTASENEADEETSSVTPVESTAPADSSDNAAAPESSAEVEKNTAVSEEPEESEAPASETASDSTVAEPEPAANETVTSSEDESEKSAEPVSEAPAHDEDSASEESNEPSADEESTAKKYDQGLEKSRTGFGARLNRFLANFRHVDEDFFDDLEDMLIESDVGYDMAMKLSDELREEVKLQNAKSKQDVSNVIIEKMVELYDAAGKDENANLNFAKEGPTVIMFVGVNGAGKTTTIGKMAALFKNQGKKVLLAAADTFRAGATEQLDVWAKRDGVDIVTGPENGDPAAVVFDAVQKAKKEDYDILFVDTAGRLQNKVNLMKELAKMKRILTREIPDAPHEVLLVLDATTGQNALNQAKLFKESTDVTGIVLTKLDGTARGGIVLAIRNELHLPVKYVGLGEKVNDLQKFDASEFVYGLFKGLVEVD